MRVPTILYAFVLSVAGTWFATVPATADEAPAPKQVIVHLSHYTDDLHAATMAIKLAGLMQHEGASVALFLDLEGVRMADGRQPQDFGWGHGQKIAEQYRDFVAAGGKVLVCPHCAQSVGLDSAALRKGAHIVTPQELAKALASAQSILDY